MGPLDAYWATTAVVYKLTMVSLYTTAVVAQYASRGPKLISTELAAGVRLEIERNC